MQAQSDYPPEWAKYLIATIVGAGGVHWFSAWLENRRLAKKEFRETLLDRIRELEKVVTSLQTRMGNLRVEMAHLEVENKQLKRRLGMLVEESNADTQDQGASDGEA